MKQFKHIFILSGLGLMARLLLLLTEFVIGADAYQFSLLARRFANGDLYGVLDPYWAPLFPLLTGIVHLFSSSTELSLQIVNILAGSLVVPVTYFLVRQTAEEREALIAASIAVFFPHLLNSVYEMGTETLYLVCIIFFLITGWRALQSGKTKDFFLPGVLIGLAYLTRPEGFGYLLFSFL